MASELENLGLDGLISSSQNIDNEIEVLRSKDYCERSCYRFEFIYIL